MNLSKRLFLTFSFLSLSFNYHAEATTTIDTIYYNRNWRVCEKAIADYYRVCTLGKGKVLYFMGAFKDYTIHNQLITEGNYDSSGRKNGLFTYYYTFGKVKRLGHFVNDEMSGLWYYYQPHSGLYYINNNYSNTEAAPVYIIKDQKLVLNNGTGSFAINTNDFPDVFRSSLPFVIEGNSLNNVKSGTWKYYIPSNFRSKAGDRSKSNSAGNYTANQMRSEEDIRLVGNPTTPKGLVRIFNHNTSNYITSYPFSNPSPSTREIIASEVYKDGRFAKGFDVRQEKLETPFNGINYLPLETQLSEALTPHAAIFGKPDDPLSYPRFKDFLVSGISPTIKVRATSYNNNLQVLSSLFTEAFTLSLPSIENKSPKSSGTEVEVELPETGSNIKFHCRFKVQSDGTVTDVSIEGNIGDMQRESIRYLLSRIQGLVPPVSNAYTDIYFYTIITKIKKSAALNPPKYFISYHSNSY